MSILTHSRTPEIRIKVCNFMTLIDEFQVNIVWINRIVNKVFFNHSSAPQVIEFHVVAKIKQKTKTKRAIESTLAIYVWLYVLNFIYGDIYNLLNPNSGNVWFLIIKSLLWIILNSNSESMWVNYYFFSKKPSHLHEKAPWTNWRKFKKWKQRKS